MFQGNPEDILMAKKLTYEELERKVEKLQKQAIAHSHTWES